ncbi:MAG: hypothetical protein ACFE89_12410, partial [Candidatus Hodarchaeota archaeon]
IMEKIDATTFLYTIPAIEIVNPFLEYYFIAKDGAGRETRLPGSDTDTFPVNILPINPTLIGIIIGASLIITVVIIVAYWYLRRPPHPSQ